MTDDYKLYIHTHFEINKLTNNLFKDRSVRFGCEVFQFQENKTLHYWYLQAYGLVNVRSRLLPTTFQKLVEPCRFQHLGAGSTGVGLHSHSIRAVEFRW